jgi:hypothetical protein
MRPVDRFRCRKFDAMGLLILQPGWIALEACKEEEEADTADDRAEAEALR